MLEISSSTYASHADEGAILMSTDFNRIRSMQTLRNLAETLDRFRELSPTMPVGEVLMFVQVALNEGASLTDLSDILDMKKSTASRYLLDLSDKMRTGDVGFGLVTRDADPDELRRNMYSLSPKGRALVNSIVSSSLPGE